MRCHGCNIGLGLGKGKAAVLGNLISPQDRTGYIHTHTYLIRLVMGKRVLQECWRSAQR